MRNDAQGEKCISIYSEEGYGMVKGIFIRTLNPPQARYFFTVFDIQPKNDIFLDSIWAKSASMETFWRQDVT
jgi:hypothetical protein